MGIREVFGGENECLSTFSIYKCGNIVAACAGNQQRK